MRRTTRSMFRASSIFTFLVLSAFAIGGGKLVAQKAEVEPNVSAVEQPPPESLPVINENFGTTVASAVSGLPIASCFTRPVATYRSGDGCLEFLERNAAYANQRHAADDFCAAASTTKVNAVAAGKVMYARAYKTCPNWGHLIAIEHLLPNGSSVVSLYGHVIPSIREGDVVSRGQQIGAIGHYSCWTDHVHFAIAQRDYGASVGTYATWLKGYLTDSDSVAPYTSPEPFVVSRLDCPPTVGNHTYSIQNLANRLVTVRFSDPEGQAPRLKAIKYQYKDATGQVRTGSGELVLSSGSAGNGTYSWSAYIYGTQFKFYTEWRDAGGNYVRYPVTGLIE
jgi:murein DD-endopeptidase MepM/ murein hydrolase activator NlpD